MKIKKARKVIRKAFKNDPDFKRVYVDNVAMYLYDNAPHSIQLLKEKKNRDELATGIIDLIFGK